MAEEKIREEITEEVIDRKGFIAWVKEHKTQLLLAGVSVTTILVSALGLKNKDAIIELWNTLKKQIEKELYIVPSGLKKLVLRNLRQQENLFSRIIIIRI